MEGTWSGRERGVHLLGIVGQFRNGLYRKPYPSTVIIHVGTNDIFDSNTFELRKLIPSVPNTVATFTHYMVRCTQDKVHEGGKEGNRKDSQ